MDQSWKKENCGPNLNIGEI